MYRQNWGHWPNPYEHRKPVCNIPEPKRLHLSDQAANCHREMFTHVARFISNIRSKPSGRVGGMYVFVSVFACRGLNRAPGYTRAGVTDGCELPDIDAGK